MSETKLQQLAKIGQSIWFDNINRTMFQTGSLKKMIDDGLRGMTSNPSIFDKAVSKSTDYDEDISALAKKGLSAFEIYDELTVADIRNAADLFMPVYESTGGLDGYVSLEIDPRMAFKTEESIAEGKRLAAKVDRPNLMLKVPATHEGFPVITALLKEGLNVNTTLIFSPAQYRATAGAYIAGIKALLEKGGDPSKVHGVASVFVSRIDSMVDDILNEKISSLKDESEKMTLEGLLGVCGVNNSKQVYSMYNDIFHSEAFVDMKAKGANAQRPLWASTGTKNSEYSDILYVMELIGKDTVNTLPDKTFEAFLDHGAPLEAITFENVSGAEDKAAQFVSAGVDMDGVFDRLLKDGVESFIKSFEALIKSIEEKAGSLGS